MTFINESEFCSLSFSLISCILHAPQLRPTAHNNEYAAIARLRNLYPTSLSFKFFTSDFKRHQAMSRNDNPRLQKRSPDEPIISANCSKKGNCEKVSPPQFQWIKRGYHGSIAMTYDRRIINSQFPIFLIQSNGIAKYTKSCRPTSKPFPNPVINKENIKGI